MERIVLFLSFLSLAAFADSAPTPCDQGFHLAASHAPAPAPALQRLRDFLQKQEDANGRDPLAHQLSTENGRAVLKIGYLTREERRFSILVLGALNEGSLQEIDAGLVLGTKVPALLNRLRSYVSQSGQGITVRGELKPRGLSLERRRQLEHGSDYDQKNPRHWSPGELADFDTAMRNLKVKEACLEHWQSSTLEKCGPLYFEFNSLHPDEIHWRR